MTTSELHEILDDENRKLTADANINRFCPYANENIMLGEYRTDDAHPTEKGGAEE